MRYLPLSDDDRRLMLKTIGAESVDDLFRDVPPAARLHDPIPLPPPMGEKETEDALRGFASQNLSPSSAPSFIGAGAYRHHIPASVDHIIQRSEFMTAYTPYQPEIAQGTLQAMFEFQSQVAILTGLDAANASMYDGASAAAEAVLMAHRLTKKNQAILSPNLHPHYRDSILTLSRLSSRNRQITAEPSATPPANPNDLIPLISPETSCVVVQNPDVFGAVSDLKPLADAAHANGALLIAIFCEVVSLGLLQSPGHMGADIAVGEGQSLGNPLSFGGPYVGLLAARQNALRQMPGRLCGQTKDADGKTGYVLTLAAREQHIRREKATSNICTNAGLCALAFSCHMTLLGGEGLAQLAKLNHARALQLAARLTKLKGVKLTTPCFFNEFTLTTPLNGKTLIDALAQKGILGGVPASRLFPERSDLANHIIIAATEMNSDEDDAAYENALRTILS